MNQLRLELVESLIMDQKNLDFSKTRIIGVQHILETTHSMFRSFYQIGLKPENISLIGKCYSTCEEVYREMLSEGIDVSSGSFAYSSHLSFDDQFTLEIKKFIGSLINDISSEKYERIIILDDGGKFIDILDRINIGAIPVVAIEQTTSGYNLVSSRNVSFPVINVARSPTKLKIESPMIAKAAADRLYLSLQKRNISPNKALIIGGGSIGAAMKERLEPDMQISVYDQNKNLSNLHNADFLNLIGSFPLIIGCTGKTTIPYINHCYLGSNTTLVSVSSSDREFDAVHLRRLISENTNCHLDLSIDNLLLINSGFPVNFDGERENIDPEMIQLTIALIAAGIIQASHFSCNTLPGIIQLSNVFENKIEKDFFSVKKHSIQK